MGTIGHTILVVVVFGAFVFVHELGHFLAAKRVGVRVEVFSLGFGPFLFTFRKGETLYAFSLIPLGGYVRMAGQSDLGPDVNTGNPYEYSSKPPFQRMQIAVAGVVMNFIGGYLAFTAAYLVGVNVTPAVAREVVPESPAAEAGIQPGDRIVAINGSPVRSYQDVRLGLVGNTGEEISLAIKAPDGTERSVSVIPGLKDDKPFLGISPDVPVHIGTETVESGAVITKIKPESPAEEAGIEELDVVVSVDDRPVENDVQLREIVRGSRGETLVVRVLRQGAPVDLIVTPRFSKKAGNHVIGVYLTTFHVVSAVVQGSGAGAAGIQPGDRVFPMGFEETTADGGDTGRSFALLLMVEHEGHSTRTIKVPVNFSESRGALLSHITIPERLRLGLIDSAVMGFHKTVDFTLLVLRFLSGLFTGLFKVGDVAGPVGVVKFVYDASKAGLGALLLLFGFISVNLGVVNLFPMPPLDGGLLVFLGYEKLRGRPLPQKVQEGFLLVGIVLLLVLVVFVTKNDIVRLFIDKGM